MEGNIQTADRTIVLSPDSKQYWDGDKWSPALLSPDGKAIWIDPVWVALETPNGRRPATRQGVANAGLYAVAICGGCALVLLIIGNTLAQGLRLIVEAVATLPVLFVHSVTELFENRRFVMPSPGLLTSRALGHAHPQSWVLTGIVFGVIQGIIDNLGGAILLRMFGLPAVFALLAVPIALGFAIRRLSLGHGRRVILVMVLAVGVVNGTFLLLAGVDLSVEFVIGFAFGLGVVWLLVSAGYALGGFGSARRPDLPGGQTSAVEVQDVAKAVKCPRCGRENLASHRFCGGCGVGLEQLRTPSPIPTPVPVTVPQEGWWFCRQCGQRNLRDNQFCESCGVPFKR